MFAWRKVDSANGYEIKLGKRVIKTLNETKSGIEVGYRIIREYNKIVFGLTR